MNRLVLPVAGLALLAGGFGAGLAASADASAPTSAPTSAATSAGTSARTSASDPVTVTRQSWAEVAGPTGSPRRTLGLSRVVVMPGAVLGSHHHPGTQLGYVAEGVLTYTVETKSAKLMKGPGDDPTLVRVVRRGQTVKVRPGHWLIERQGEVHHASNQGDVPVVIYLSTLFRTGAPSAISD